MWSLTLRLLLALLVSVSVSAQTPQSKPKPAPAKPAATKPGTAKPAPAKVEPAPVPAPAPPPPPTDLQVRTRYTMGAQVSENRTYIKGPRQRFEFPGITMITQCDLKRSLQLHDATKHYMVTSTDAATPAPTATPAPAAPTNIDAATAAQMAAMTGGQGASPAPKGGVVAETITITDTGDRQQMFGFDARRIKTVVSRQPGAGACETTAATVETDGWYADLPEYAACPYLPQQAPPPPPAGQQACVDRVETKKAGETTLGFALKSAVTTTVTDVKDKTNGPDVSTITMEVLDLKVTTLEAALFDVPAGFTEVQDYQALLPSVARGGSVADAVFGSIAEGTSTVAPKNAGVIRIGVATPSNKSGKDLPDLRLLGSVLSGFTKQPFEGVMVSGESPAELDRDAAAKACDFVLVSDVAEVKTSKPNKVGGFLKKVSGDTTGATEIHEARIDYKLFAVGDPAKPKATSSIKQNSGGGFGIGSALKLAAFAGQMYLTMGMGAGMMMNMLGPASSFGSMTGMGGGMPIGRMNPGMGAAMSIMNAGTSMMGIPGAAGGSDDKLLETVQGGLTRAGKQVADELKKGRASGATKKPE